MLHRRRSIQRRQKKTVFFAASFLIFLPLFFMCQKSDRVWKRKNALLTLCFSLVYLYLCLSGELTQIIFTRHTEIYTMKCLFTQHEKLEPQTEQSIIIFEILYCHFSYKLAIFLSSLRIHLALYCF